MTVGICSRRSQEPTVVLRLGWSFDNLWTKVMNKVMHKSYEQKLWTQAVNKCCEKVLSTSRQQKLKTKVVNKSYGLATFVQGTVVKVNSCPRRQLSKGEWSKETLVQGDISPRRLLTKGNLVHGGLLSKETIICILVQERNIARINLNKLGLRCAKLSTAWASYPLANQLELAISLCWGSNYTQLCLFN